MGKPAVLSIRLITDASQTKKQFGDTETAASKMSAGMDKASVAAAVVVGGLAAFAVKLEAAGEAAATSNARIENITKQMGLMGDQSGVVSDRVIKNAERMAKATGIDPNMIKQGAATLSTFENLARTADQVGGMFDRATTASTDLSAAGFGSVESAATMLGKALNDPVKGMAAMSRVGVTFSEEQKAMAQAMQDAGDIAGAQELVMQAVERQVGNTAEATANASDKMKVSWQLAEEELGQKLLPLFDKFRSIGIDAATWIADNADLVLWLAGGLGTLAAGILIVNGAMKTYAAIQVIQTAAQWAQNSAWLASPVTWVILAIVAAIALVIAIVWVWIENWDVLSKAVEDGVNVIGDATGNVFGWIGDGWNNLTDGMTSGVDFMIQKISELLRWVEEIGRAAGLGWVWDAFPDWPSTRAVSYATASDETMTRSLRDAPAFHGYAAPQTPAYPRLNSRSGGESVMEGNRYEINVTGAIDPDSTAKQILDLIKQYDRRTGGRPAAGGGV